ncbi:MAG: peptidoglycan DD-metalloendopeptidase family protein, partial [Burkholderiales bacterium]|nr:peptidoglycan DD-metalloendopeptidase family protein [Burkholderiales bacterium]
MQPAAAIQATPLEAVAPPPLLKTPKAVKQPYSEQALAQLRGLPYKPPATATTPGTSAASASPPLPPRSPSTAGTAPAAAPPVSVPATPTQGTVIASPTAARPAPDTAAPPQAAWAWPARGRLLHGFNAGPNPKGIAISGELGQPVWASAAGKVVYSGSGLRGYGKLIIVKHDKTYLSVYAHNRELLVKEGEQVAKGQKIAEMGNSESNRVALHFEIRRLGKP